MLPRATQSVILLLAPLIASILFLTACRDKQTHYPLHGEIIKINSSKNEITVKHDAIPNLMPAMAMPYRVQDSTTLKDLKIGDTINADLVVIKNGDNYWLEHVQVVPGAKKGG